MEEEKKRVRRPSTCDGGTNVTLPVPGENGRVYRSNAAQLALSIFHVRVRDVWRLRKRLRSGPAVVRSSTKRERRAPHEIGRPSEAIIGRPTVRRSPLDPKSSFIAVRYRVVCENSRNEHEQPGKRPKSRTLNDQLRLQQERKLVASGIFENVFFNVHLRPTLKINKQP